MYNIVKKYYIIQHDYKTNDLQLVYTGPLIECQHMIEELSERLIENLQGSNIEIIYYNKNDKNRMLGYFIQQDETKNNKLIVKRKYQLNGYIYNSIVVDNIKSFEIITSDVVKYHFYNKYFCEQYKYNIVMNQFRNTINFFNKYDIYNKCLKEMKDLYFN